MKQLLKEYWLRTAIIITACGIALYYRGLQEGQGKMTYYIYTLIMAIAFVMMLAIPFAIEEYKKNDSKKKITKSDLGFMGITYLISLILIAVLLDYRVSLVFVSVSFLGYAIIVVLNLLIARLNQYKGQ